MVALTPFIGRASDIKQQTVISPDMKNFVMGVFDFMNRLFGYSAHKFTTVDCDEFERGMQQDGVQLVDVRQASEYEAGTLEGAVNIDYLQPNFVEKALDVLDVDNSVYVFCRSGHRSANAAKLLAKNGFTVVNLDGGWLAWTAQGKPTV